jgi:hypothetical protein
VDIAFAQNLFGRPFSFSIDPAISITVLFFLFKTSFCSGAYPTVTYCLMSFSL